MIITDLKNLNKEEKKLINETKKIAHNSITNKKSLIGVIIKGTRNGIYKGATVARTRAIGSTCSERMALDQLYFHKKEKPKLVYIIGNFKRKGWKESYICTPCGTCLEMFFEATKFFKIKSIKFICSSWDKSKILKCDLEELFPQIEKGNWERNE